ncbi:LuxR family transcriptional regulator [Rhizobium daejeonense]|uniref:LuxR family transcriptional regulator n=1 Tax=Rhizobium daejeonense TaxID=240521 RepID=A0A6M1S6T4_9HYPH|nr:autoinducer binding domain-containing protein [Rhizobium daejeonense]NGO66021.1 LuxR family transcriptional regulator [Rhizobium daejeonense]
MKNLLFNRLSEACATASDQKSFGKALGRITRSYGFNGFAYLHLHGENPAVVTNYPREWQVNYLDRGYARLDPVVKAARAQMQAFSWSVDEDRRHGNGDIRKFCDEAVDFGIRSGLSVPIQTGHGKLGILTLSSSRPAHDSNGNDLDPIRAAAAAAFVHNKLIHTAVDGVIRPTTNLTHQELTCLYWSAEGKSMEDIATMEGLKYSTVRFYIEAAKKKLGTITLSQATAVATRWKLI